MAEAGESAHAEAALEAALMPSSRLLGDWTLLANEYLSANDGAIVVEDVTRRAGALRALDAGRLDAAALIYSSCAFRDDGALDTTLHRVTPLAARHDELSPIAWRAASCVKLLLERLTRRYTDCLGTALGVLSVLDDDDPSRGFFDMWRCALTTAVAPEAGLAEIDAVLPSVLRHAASAPRLVGLAVPRHEGHGPGPAASAGRSTRPRRRVRRLGAGREGVA